MPRRFARVLASVLVAGVVVSACVFSGRRWGNDQRDVVGPDSIVMLGDSITEQGDWDSLLADVPVVNAGHSGFTTSQLVPVAEEVARHRPAMVFVLTGTNDIRDNHPASWTVRHLVLLIDAIRRASPDTVIVLQTILPRADRAVDVRASVDAIRSVATARDLRVLDLNTEFDAGDGGLRADETTDGIHLSDAGYERWVALLRSELRG